MDYVRSSVFFSFLDIFRGFLSLNFADYFANFKKWMVPCVQELLTTLYIDFLILVFSSFVMYLAEKEGLPIVDVVYHY